MSDGSNLNVILVLSLPLGDLASALEHVRFHAFGTSCDMDGKSVVREFRSMSCLRHVVTRVTQSLHMRHRIVGHSVLIVSVAYHFVLLLSSQHTRSPYHNTAHYSSFLCISSIYCKGLFVVTLSLLSLLRMV